MGTGIGINGSHKRVQEAQELLRGDDSISGKKLFIYHVSFDNNNICLLVKFICLLSLTSLEQAKVDFDESKN